MIAGTHMRPSGPSQRINHSKATWAPPSHLTNALDILANYLCRVQTLERSAWNRGATIIIKGAGEDLP